MKRRIFLLALLALSAIAAGVWLANWRVPPSRLTHLGTFTWPTESVVGLSGLEMSDDGHSFVAIGDRGWFLTGTFQRTDGRISGLDIGKLVPVRGNDGLPAAARRASDWSDSEGLAMAPDGTIWVSFEQWARVARYDSIESGGAWIKDHATFRDYRPNRQLEALAISPEGDLYTFPERPLEEGFPIYRLDGKTWTIDGYIPEQQGFSLVGADFDSDGRLYLLERKLLLGLWWQNRVRRLTLGVSQQDEILWTDQPGDYDNLEGIALWHDAGKTIITLVSDNNSNEDEPAQFVEFRVND